MRVLLAEFDQEVVILIVFILKLLIFLFFRIVIILHEVLISEIMHAVRV